MNKEEVGRIRILPEWNVKKDRSKKHKRITWIRILPEWNVKLHDKDINPDGTVN